MDVDVLRENDSFVSSLQQAFHSGEVGLSNVPALIKRVIAEDRWRCRYVRVLAREVGFPSFAAFLGAAVPEGLGADLATVKRLCGDDPEAMDLIDRATQQASHRPLISVDIINTSHIDRPDGTSSQAALRRLRKDRPDLHEQVIQRQKSPHAAMVEAGFRKATWTAPDDITAMPAAILRRFYVSEVGLLIVWLLRHPDIAQRLQQGMTSDQIAALERLVSDGEIT